MRVHHHRPLSVPLFLVMTAAATAACKHEPLTSCPVPVGQSATCEQACANLFDLDCRVGNSAAQCETICAGTTSALPSDVRDRVIACYAQVDSCHDVDGCGKTCGPGDMPIPFSPPPEGGAGDAGSPDAGQFDAGVVDGGACAEDILEDNDAVADASTAALPSSNGASLCADDDDFFTVELTTGATLHAEASFGAGELNLQLLSVAGVPLAEAGLGASPRSATYEALADGPVIIRLTSAVDVGPYTLALTSP